MYPGKTEEQKNKLAAEITKSIMNVTHNAELSASVSIEDIAPNDWVDKVYKPNILEQWDKLYKKPGYGLL